MRGFLNLLKPKEWKKSIFEIDFEDLLSRGFRVFIFDYDNTLVPWRVRKVPEEVSKIIEDLSGRATVIIASNGKEKEIEGLKCKVIWRARKPFAKKLKKLLEEIDTDKDKVVVIGDQIFTDVFFGNRMGFYTIKVEPVSRREFWGTKILRLLERIVLPFIR
mgnify:CR=1 FL=1